MLDKVLAHACLRIEQVLAVGKALKTCCPLRNTLSLLHVHVLEAAQDVFNVVNHERHAISQLLLKRRALIKNCCGTPEKILHR